MIRYPLEWGWHTAPEADTPTTESHQPDGTTPVAWGDKSCSSCSPKGGKIGMYEMEGKILCWNCAVKRAGLENESGRNQADTLEPFLLKPR